MVDNNHNNNSNNNIKINAIAHTPLYCSTLGMLGYVSTFSVYFSENMQVVPKLTLFGRLSIYKTIYIYILYINYN